GAASHVEDLGLLRRELLLGEDALVLQRRELLELRDRVGLGRGGGGRLLVDRLLGVLLLRVLLVVLLRPARGLAARDAVADGGGRPGDDGGAGYPAEQSWHEWFLSISRRPRSR